MPNRALIALILLATGTAHAALVIGDGQGAKCGTYEPGIPYKAPAFSAYYTHGHLAVGYLNLGVMYGADGLFAQYRVLGHPTRNLQTSLAVGPEVLNETDRSNPSAWQDHYVPSLLVSLGASYRVLRDWRIGIRWEHVTFARSRAYHGWQDADVELITLGYGH